MHTDRVFRVECHHPLKYGREAVQRQLVWHSVDEFPFLRHFRPNQDLQPLQQAIITQAAVSGVSKVGPQLRRLDAAKYRDAANRRVDRAPPDPIYSVTSMAFPCFQQETTIR